MTNDFLFLRINEAVFNINLIFCSSNGPKKQFKPYVFNPCNEKLLLFYNSFYVYLLFLNIRQTDHFPRCENDPFADQLFQIFLLVSDIQFFKDRGDFFHRSKTGRYQRQTQLVLNHTHRMKHGLDSRRIAIYKQKLEEFRKFVMNSTGYFIFAV